MVKCEICKISKPVKYMKYFPILNFNEKNEKKLYCCSKKCYGLYKENWKRNEIEMIEEKEGSITIKYAQGILGLVNVSCRGELKERE